MAEEPGKCRYIMGILEKNKKSKGTAFVYDENNDYYKMEINGIEFVCDSIHSDYEKHAVELAQAYEKRLPDIVDYLMPDIKEMFGITNPDVIANSLGKPSIDLDRGTLTYLEHTMDSHWKSYPALQVPLPEFISRISIRLCTLGQCRGYKAIYRPHV